jgi:hypothetical protein
MAPRLTECGMRGQAMNSIPGVKDKEAKVAKLNSKRSKLGSVIWATAICYKRKVAASLEISFLPLAKTKIKSS